MIQNDQMICFKKLNIVLTIFSISLNLPISFLASLFI